MRSVGHVQGIAFDGEQKYLYVSFTTALMKVDVETGETVGTVDGITGHLGCIDFCDKNGKLYGSIEYKHDQIGSNIARRLGISLADEDAFYVAIFDVDKIDRVGMDAEKDGVMRAVYLPDVIDDFSATLSDGTKHRHGCSGIDGITVGRVFGEDKDSCPHALFVAYGIYSDVERDDNDYQVLLRYDPDALDRVARPLSQLAPHHEGIAAEGKYLVYTGNTRYGIQNLEYDAHTGDYFAAVYKGKKEKFPNYPMFVIDGGAPVTKATLDDGQVVNILSLKDTGIRDEASGISGLDFPLGSTGLYSLGNGYFYVSHDGKTEDGTPLTDIHLYKFTGDETEPFVMM